VSLIEMMIIGFKSLEFSANEAAKDDPPPAKKKKTKADADEGAAIEDAVPAKAEGGFSKAEMALTFTFSIALGIGLFVVVPNLATHFTGRLFGDPSARLLEEQSPVVYNLVSGFIRVLIVVGYIWAISLMKDIRRLFQYHGAEHKTVSAFEAGKELTVENVRPYSTLHPRCGTTFIAIVLVVAIIVFAVFARVLVAIWPEFNALTFPVRKTILILGHIAIMPVVAGVCFELLKLGGRFPRNPLLLILITPGYWFQRLTTKEPDDSMLEVAIHALQSAFAAAKAPEPAQSEPVPEAVVV
jgi:uncharacterized protein YqhQ